MNSRDSDALPIGRIVKWIVIFVLGAVVLSVFSFVTGNLGGAISSVATAPSRVIQRTLETDNIISNYEWYHDAYATYLSRINQIAAHRKLIETAGSDGERQRLRIDLAGMQQSCRTLATQYNANATKTNKSIFMGREAPPYLNMSDCE